MGLETYFRVFAVDNTGKRARSKEWIEEAWKEELKHGCLGSEKSEEELNKEIKERGIAPFIEVRKEPDADSEKYHYLPEQEADPFPLWIDVASGNLAYEVLETNFLSDFDELYKHYNLESGSVNCCEISVDDAEDMLAVLEYIQKGKYDRDIEEMAFRNNEFFKVFEDQFFNFGMRFRNRKKESSVQTIKIIVEDRRTDVKRMDSIDDEESDWDVQEERAESESNERWQIEHLKNVLNAFLMMKEPDYAKDPKVVYKLGYFLSY